MLSPRTMALVFDRDLGEVPRVSFRGAGAPKSYSVNFAANSLVASKVCYYVEKGFVHFILNEQNFPNICKAGGVDYYLCGNFNGWHGAIGSSRWKLARFPDSPVWKVAIPMDFFADRRKKYLFKFADSSGRWLEPLPDSINITYDAEGNSNLRFDPNRTGKNAVIIGFTQDFDISLDIRIGAPDITSDEARVDSSRLFFRLDASEKLGARVENGRTRFAMFSPKAQAVSLCWMRDENSAHNEVEMRKVSATTWAADVEGNLHGCLYYYNICGENADSSTAFDAGVKVADPFARAMLKSASFGFVVDDSQSPKPRRRFTPPHWHDLVIVEAHVRDVLANAPAEISSGERLGFAGLSKWLKDPECYLRTCGANCVELMPVSEYMYSEKSEYQWGYMPVNWFSPASAYGTEPAKMSQVHEFAQLVEAFHDAGLAVVLDVVYNHVGEPNSLLRLDKKYFFETDNAGHLINFSGCGNDLRAGTPVGKRLIIESLKHLVETYDVDGFRFDLAELLGVEVLKEIEKELKKVKPSIILIAEPWSFRGHIAHALKDTGFASWNDGFREFAKAYVMGGGDAQGMKYFLGGSMGGLAAWPSQSVNYIESHDDTCFFDRIAKNYDEPSGDDVRRYKLGYAFALLSMGIPMLAEGFDMLRTKHGLNNTYLNGDANALVYARAMRHTGVCAWLRGLVHFRLSSDAAALRRAHPVGAGYLRFFEADGSHAICALFNADKSADAKRVFVAFNPSIYEQKIATPDFDFESFRQIADIDRLDARGLSSMLVKQVGGSISIPAHSVCVWVEK